MFFDPKKKKDGPAMLATPGLSPVKTPLDTSRGDGGGWLNLQSYLGVNRDQGQKAANAIAGTVAKQGEQVKTMTGKMRGQFFNQMGKDQTANAPGTFSSMADMQGYGSLANKAAQVGEQAKGLTGFGTRQQTVNQTFGKDTGDYSAGMGQWDNFLAGNADKGKFQQTADKYGGLAKELGAYVDETGAFGKDYAQKYGAGAFQPAPTETAYARMGSQRDNAGRGDLQNSTVTVDDERQAMFDGTYYEWVADGMPPYDEWKKGKGK